MKNVTARRARWCVLTVGLFASTPVAAFGQTAPSVLTTSQSKRERIMTTITPVAESRSAATEGNTIRPFRVNMPEEAVRDLKRRLAAAR